MKSEAVSFLTVAVLFLSSILNGEEKQPSAITRQQVIDRIINNIQLLPTQSSTVGDLTDEQKQALLTSLQSGARRLSQQVLPESFAVSSGDRLPALLATTLLISETDVEYNRALIERWLLGFAVNFAAEKVIKPLPAATVEALRNNIVDLRKGIEATMIEHLGQYFSKKEITDYLDRMQGLFFQKIDHPLSYNLRVPLSKPQQEQLLSEFRTRLIESLDRIPKRLEKAERIENPQHKQEQIDSIKNMILSETTTKPFLALAQKSSDQSIPNMDPHALTPYYAQYLQANEKCEALNRKIIAQRVIRLKEKQEERRRQRMVEDWREDVTEAANDVIEGDILSEGGLPEAYAQNYLDNNHIAPMSPPRTMSPQANSVKPESSRNSPGDTGPMPTALPTSRLLAPVILIVAVSALVLTAVAIKKRSAL